ncbi:hypothetical protein ACP70R_000584 [Stipagrostis hirtigluma subsp. patula]
MAPAAATATATTVDRREGTASVVGGWNLPTDAFVEVLLRLPPRRRRRLRLVCRYWRDVINERAPVRRSQPTLALAFVVNYEGYTKVSATAYAIDDVAQGRCREVWRSKPVPPTPRGRGAFDTAMVGTCNGVLCLCDNTRPGGAVSLVNPAIGWTLAVPPLPSFGWLEGSMISSGWDAAYSFAYEPTTERYKVVHLPCYLDRTGGFDAVQVFTLAAAAEEVGWRDVPVPGASCSLAAGLVSVDGATYWVTKDAASVVALDLKDERVAFTKALPVASGRRRDYSWHLAEVHGSLGAVSSSDYWLTPEKIEVWVLGGGEDRQAWSRRYSVQVNDGMRRWIGRPHFAHGEYILTEGDDKEVFVLD